MAHNIEYFVYDENIKRDWVQQKLDHYVSMEDWQEGCKGLGQNIRWLESAGIMESDEEAQQYISDHDRGNYDQLAVRFYVYEQPDSSIMKSLEGRRSEALSAYLELQNRVWPAERKADYVGCRGCGSRLCRTFLKSNMCPVCKADLRSDTALRVVTAAKARYDKADKAVKDYTNTHGKKIVKWLVKIEYHT